MIVHDHRLLSQPLKLFWAGWEANTYRLQQAGWQLSAEQDIANDGMRIALKHPKWQVRALTEIAPFPYYESAMRLPTLEGREFLPPLRVAWLANDIILRAHASIAVDAFKPVDAMPQLQAFESLKRLEELVHFAPAHAQQQLIVPEASVPDLLKRILEMQQGSRLERFREEVRRDQAERPQLHAQILSFPRAA